MPSTPSGEFVFKEDGRGKLQFVGDFEGLYQKYEDPWGQAADQNSPMARYYCFSRSQLLGVIQRRTLSVPQGEFTRGLEVGCGLGYVSRLLTHMTRLQFDGTDVSDAAVRRAQELHPKLNFFEMDITRGSAVKGEWGRYDVVILCQVLWYVMHEMSTVLDNCHKLLPPGGLLIVSQAFLNTTQRYGSDIADGFDGAMKLLLKCERQFSLIEMRYEDRLGLCHNDGLFVLRRN